MEKKLRIAFFVDSFYPTIDGVVKVVDNYARRLSASHEVTVFAPDSFDKNFAQQFPYRVVRCKILPMKFGDYPICVAGWDKKVKKLLDREKFDIVHLHSPFMVGKLGLNYARKNNIPVVITCHSQYQQDFYNTTKSRLIAHFLIKNLAKTYNFCDELWTMNRNMKALVRSFGYGGKVKIMPNGCDCESVEYQPSELEIFRKLYAKNDEKILLFVGRIYKLKNIDFIIRVCEELKQKGFKFKMLFVGGGKLLSHYKKLTEKRQLTYVINFIGEIANREEIKKFYALADLFVFPSAYDSDALVKSEAAAFYTPTIFLENTICAAYVKDFVNGYIGENDAKKFADKIIKVLSDEKQYAGVCKLAHDTLYLPWNDIIQSVERGYICTIKRKEKELTAPIDKNRTKKVQKRLKKLKKPSQNKKN